MFVAQIMFLLVDYFTSSSVELLYVEFPKKAFAILLCWLPELLCDLCVGEMGIFQFVENAYINQQFEVQQKKCSFSSDQYSLIVDISLCFLAWLFYALLILLGRKKSLILKIHFS